MSGEPKDRPRPLIPRLFLVAIVVLALSWLAFMVHYVTAAKDRPKPELMFDQSPSSTNRQIERSSPTQAVERAKP